MISAQLIIFCGIPFAGKTTQAKQLSSQIDATRIDLDEIKFKLFGSDVIDEDIDQSGWDKIYQQMYKEVEQELRAGHKVVHDTGNFTKYERGLIQQIAQKIGIEFVTVFVDTPYEIARVRWEENQKNPSRFHISEESFESAVKEMEPPGEEEHRVALAQIVQ